MKVAILSFSPAGNTRKVAKMLEESLEKKEHKVQNLELRRKDLFRDPVTLRDYIKKNLEPHDLVMVGSPVYFGHMLKKVQEIIQALPVAGNGYGRPAALFLTWGGRTTGTAFREGIKQLKKTGRVPVAGMKFLSFHAMSKGFDQKLNQGLPAEEARQVADAFAQRLTEVDPRSLPDASKKIKAQRLGKVIECKVFTEKLFQRKFFPKLSTVRDKCEQCGACVKICPVQIIRTDDDGYPHRVSDGGGCIHCGECYFCCKSNATEYDARKFEKICMKAVVHKEGGKVEGQGNTCLII